MIVPSSFATPEAQLHILSIKNCKLYLRPKSMANAVNKVIEGNPAILTVTAPEIDELLCPENAEAVAYEKSWEDSKDDPWLVFHTSGTTGEHRVCLVPVCGWLTAI